MEAPIPDRLTYEQARQLRQRIRSAEVPIEHAVSLPIPTLRWGLPGFGYFASPAVRNPDGPTQLAAPDRWWGIDARRGRLVFYALTSAMPLTPHIDPDSFASSTGGLTIDDLRQLHRELEQSIDGVLDSFFEGRCADQASRRRVVDLLQAVVGNPQMGAYRALAPDFWAWLEA